MAGRWDDIEILQAIDRIQQQNDGRPLWQSGYDLMNEIAGVFAVEPHRMPGFLQELLIASQGGLLTFSVSDSNHPAVRPQDANLYLQHIRGIALTVAGQDRARGRVVVQPHPDSAEDDGRQLSNLIFKQIATVITEEYAPDEVAEFLAAEGIPPDELPLPEGMAEGDAYTILTALWRWGPADDAAIHRPLAG
jgi:hypothetical protein